MSDAENEPDDGYDGRSENDAVRTPGGMGVSSERVGPTGPGQLGTHGVRYTGPVEPEEDADVPPQQRPGAVEGNPAGLEPKADHPSLDPRSQDA